MKMNWYYRMMLSYTPIFFFVISSVIFLFFSTLNNSSEKKYLETNQAIVEQTMQNVDANLQLIERNVVREMQTDKTLQAFFNEKPKSLYDYFVIQKKLVEISSSLPFVNSIYIYSDHTGKVLSEAGMVKLEAFKDKPFFDSHQSRSAAMGWTSPREYSQSILDDSTRKVVSLVKAYPFASDKQGAVVVNLNVSSIIDFMNQFNGYGGTIQLLDWEKKPFESTLPSAKEGGIYASSPYTGWQYYADSVHANEFSALSLFSNMWFIIVFIIIILALVWFTFITHVSYKPIQTIMGKIDGYAARKSQELGIKMPRNEFKFIETAIDHLLKKSIDYEHLHKEDLLLRQRNLLQELLVGRSMLTDQEWKKQASALGLPHSYEYLGVIALEIDHFAAFTDKYKASDQNLLKFLIESAFRELMQQKELQIQHVWTEPQRMAFVVLLQQSSESIQDRLVQVCEEFRKWMNEHLELTVSCGIGDFVHSIHDIAAAYRSAAENVSYKAVFGTNSVIDNRLRCTKQTGETLLCFQSILELSRSCRMDDGQWEIKLSRIFLKLKGMLISRADIEAFIHNLIRQLEKDMEALPSDIETIWSSEYRSRFRQIAQHAETIDELEIQLAAVLTELAGDRDKKRLNGKNHTIALQTKEYIDQHYTDPSLSLIQVSEKLGLSARSVSHLFKEELGENFIDYLLKVRFAHAKNMLLETDEPIQWIAEQVGYTHVISFHRAFKKLFNLPPGEYRTIYRLNE